jgi:hypothetical protein
MHRLYRPLLMVLLLTLTLAGCAPTIYGVPEDRWAKMSEAERAATQQAYTERQHQYELERAEQARRDAAAAAAAQREAQEQARRDREQVEAIHRGESGVYGDLIRVTVSGGTMEFYGKRLAYEPTTFTLANREQRHISFRSAGSRAYRTLDVPVSYLDGTLTFDTGRRPLRLLQSPHWKRGEQYDGLILGKHSVSDGQGLTLRVEIVPQSGVIVVDPHGRALERPKAPPGVIAAGRQYRVIRVESYGMYPNDLELRVAGKQCIKMSPYEEHNKTNTGLKSFVIEHNGIAAVVEIIDVKTHDNTRRKNICRADHSHCQESSDWMALKVNGTALFLYANEVKRLEFEGGATLRLSAIVIHDRHEREGSALCWN